MQDRKTAIEILESTDEVELDAYSKGFQQERECWLILPSFEGQIVNSLRDALGWSRPERALSQIEDGTISTTAVQ